MRLSETKRPQTFCRSKGQFTNSFAFRLLVLLTGVSLAQAQEPFPAQRSTWEESQPPVSSSQRMLQAPRRLQPQQPISEYSPAEPEPVSHRDSAVIPASYQAPAPSEPLRLKPDSPPTEEQQTFQPERSAPRTLPPEISQVSGQETVFPEKTANSSQALPLSRPAAQTTSPNAPPVKRVGSTGSQLGMTVVVLAAIITLMLVLAKVLKKHTPLAGKQLPPEVLDLLGRKMLDQRNAIHYVRAGNRILIIGVSLEGMRTLAEITDPVEIDRISGQCRTESPVSSMTNSFRFLLSRTERTENPVQIDQQHRQRQRSKKSPALFRQPASFDWETPEPLESTADDSGISPADIAELTRTLEAARERHT